MLTKLKIISEVVDIENETGGELRGIDKKFFNFRRKPGTLGVLVRENVGFRQALISYLKTKGLEVLSPCGYFKPFVELRDYNLYSIDLSGRVKQGPLAFFFDYRGSFGRRAYHVELTCYKHPTGDEYSECPRIYYEKDHSMQLEKICGQCEAIKSICDPANYGTIYINDNFKQDLKEMLDEAVKDPGIIKAFERVLYYANGEYPP